MSCDWRFSLSSSRECFGIVVELHLRVTVSVAFVLITIFLRVVFGHWDWIVHSCVPAASDTGPLTVGHSAVYQP